MSHRSVYFLKNGGFTDAESWMANVAQKTGGTGIYYGEGHQVTYEELIELLDKDETAIRDINIGYQNSISVQGDLAGKQWKKLGKHHLFNYICFRHIYILLFKSYIW